MKRTYFMRGYGFFLMVLFLSLSLSVAHATEVSAPQFDAKKANIFSVDGETAPPSGLVRAGAAVKNMSFQLDAYKATGSATCTNGKWVTSASGTCPPSSCSGTAGTAAKLKVTEKKTCTGDYCFFETEDMPDKSKNFEIGKTNFDDMFRIAPKSDGFLEYKNCTDIVYWLQRQDGGPQLHMAIPTKCGDYDRFISHHPTNAVKIETACRPATFELCARSCTEEPIDGVCGTMNTTPATNGTCGSANGGTFASAPTTNLCATGTAGSFMSTSTGYSWNCSGNNGGTNASCTAKKPNDEFYWGKFGGVAMGGPTPIVIAYAPNPYPGCTGRSLKVPVGMTYISGSYKVGCFNSKTKLIVNDANCEGIKKDPKVQNFCYVSYQENGVCKSDWLGGNGLSAMNYGARFGDQRCNDETLLLPSGDGWWDWGDAGRGTPAPAGAYDPNLYSGSAQNTYSIWWLLHHPNTETASPQFTAPDALEDQRCEALEMINDPRRCR